MRRQLLLPLILLASVSGCRSGPAEPIVAPLWAGLEPGPHTVGFRAVEVVDVARQRPLRIGVWYPARPSARLQPMPIATYLRLLQVDSAEQAFSDSRIDLALLGQQLNSVEPHRLSEAGLARLAETATPAVVNASSAGDDFPLLLWGLRHSTLLAQSVLSEYLASHGYRVAAVEPGPLRPIYPWLAQPEEALARTISLWVDDLEAALRHLQPPERRQAPLGLLAWSYGGVSTALLAARDRRVRALVSFDATGFWTIDRLESRWDWEPDRFRARLLEMRIPRDDSRSLYEQTPLADATRLTFDGLGHGNFNSAESLLPRLFDLEPLPPWTQAEAAAQGYPAAARLARDFLDHTFSSDGSWTPPAGDFAVEARQAVPPPPSAEERIATVLGGARDYDPDWVIDVASRLMDEGRWEEALGLLRRNAEHHPASAEAFYRLGEALVRARRPAEAREPLEQTLRLSLRHPEATRLLETLPEP